MSIGSTSWYKLKEAGANFATRILPWGVAAGAAGAYLKDGIQQGFQFLMGNDYLKDLDQRQVGTIMAGSAMLIAAAYQTVKNINKDKTSAIHYTVTPGDTGTMNEQIEGILDDAPRLQDDFRTIGYRLGILTHDKVLTKDTPVGGVAVNPANHRIEAYKNFVRDMVAAYASKGEIMPLSEKGKQKDGVTPLWVAAPAGAVPMTAILGSGYKLEVGFKNEFEMTASGEKKTIPDTVYIKTYRKKGGWPWFSKMVEFKKFKLLDAGDYKELESIVA